MDSLEETIKNTCHAYPGGIQSLAADLSVNEGTFYNKCNPRMPSHHINLHEALEIMRLSQDFSILQTLCRKTHHACVSIVKFQHLCDMDLFNAWTACDMEHGKTVEIIKDALADGRIYKAEFKNIRSEMFIDFAHQLELLDRLKQFSDDIEETPEKTPTLANAVHKTVESAQKDLPELASSIGMRTIDLQKKSDPENTDHILTVQESLKLIQQTDNYTILNALAKELNHTCIAIPLYEGINDMELLDAWSSWSDERGDTVSVIHTTLSDEKIEKSELLKIEKEMFQDFHTELALLARLRFMIK